MSFDDRNFSAYLNRSYSDGFSPPPDICGKQRHSNGYLHPCNRNEKGISSNHDYLSVQGSIREEAQVDKGSDKPPDLPHSKYITNKEEVTELDDVRIYYEIADSTKPRTSGQSDIKCFDQKEYVLRPADDYCLPQDKETNKPSANSPCSPCRIIILAAIIIILLIGLGCAAYFLWLRNTNEKSSSSQAPSTTIQPHYDSCANAITPQKKTVNMTVHADQIVDLTFPRILNLHTCTGNIGNRSENIEVEMRLAGDSNYHRINPKYTTKTEATVHCTLIRVIKFWINFTTVMDNATIRCKLTNDLNPDVSPVYSKPEMLFLVSDDFCYQDYNFTTTYKYHHPTTCHRFVTCVWNKPYVNECPSNRCFSVEKDYCDDCHTVKTCA